MFGAAVFFAQQKTKAVQKCLFAYILRSKMFSTAKNKGSAKMDLMQKWIWCKNLFWRTFSKYFFFAKQKTHGGFATIVAKMHFCNHGYILHSKMLQSSEGRMLCEAKIVPMACGHRL